MASKLFHAVVGVGISLGAACGGNIAQDGDPFGPAPDAGTFKPEPEGGVDAGPVILVDAGSPDALPPEAAPADAAPAPDAAPVDAAETAPTMPSSLPSVTTRGRSPSQAGPCAAPTKARSPRHPGATDQARRPCQILSRRVRRRSVGLHGRRKRDGQPRVAGIMSVAVRTEHSPSGRWGGRLTHKPLPERDDTIARLAPPTRAASSRGSPLSRAAMERRVADSFTVIAAALRRRGAPEALIALADSVDRRRISPRGAEPRRRIALRRSRAGRPTAPAAGSARPQRRLGGAARHAARRRPVRS